LCGLLNDGRSLVARSPECAAFRDKTPLSEGHTLIIPVRHEPDFLALTAHELNAIITMAIAIRSDLASALHPDGFNIGANVGEAGGQTVGHAHLHDPPKAAPTAAAAPDGADQGPSKARRREVIAAAAELRRGRRRSRHSRREMIAAAAER
jgi:diadenosine tetraphosphate (Ap4A) HIT family hydrolase